MTSPITHFKTIAGAAVLSVVLSAAPAFAQSGPAVNFSIQLPGNASIDVQTFGNSTSIQRQQGGRYYRALTNREVRQGIEAYGYSRVQVTRELRRDRVEVQAIHGNARYSMRVDKRTGYVDQFERIGRAYGNGFGFQFDFGNGWR